MQAVTDFWNATEDKRWLTEVLGELCCCSSMVLDDHFLRNDVGLYIAMWCDEEVHNVEKGWILYPPPQRFFDRKLFGSLWQAAQDNFFRYGVSIKGGHSLAMAR